MREKQVTLRDVAVAAHVSTGTASHALNGSSLIRVETRARVVEAAARLNYVPNRNASRLLRGRSECIGVGFTGLGPSIVDATFYAMVVRGITTALEKYGYSLRLVRLDDDASSEATEYNWAHTFTKQDVDGIIILNWQDRALMERLQRIGVPAVVVDVSAAYPDIPAVDNDDRGGVATGVDYLIQLGHREIALLNITLDHPFGREALAGYFQAHHDHDLAVAPGLLRTAEISITEGRLAMAHLLAGKSRPTAVFAVADELAVGVMQAITEAGLRVPDDISVVGMDDISLAAQTRPALTTVRVDMEALGRRAIDMLVQVIDGKPLASNHVVLPTHLVVRDSAAPPSPRSAAPGA